MCAGIPLPEEMAEQFTMHEMFTSHMALERRTPGKNSGMPAPGKALAVRFPGKTVFPATLFNSMIAAWTRFPIRGVIWHPGRSNAARADCSLFTNF